MNFDYKLHNEINLYVKGRISKDDAERQKKTAKKVLKNLRKYPGQIIADEVGMGKTFVALAVELAAALPLTVAAFAGAAAASAAPSAGALAYWQDQIPRQK